MVVPTFGAHRALSHSAPWCSVVLFSRESEDEDSRIKRVAGGMVCDGEGQSVGGWFSLLQNGVVLAWLVVLMQKSCRTGRVQTRKGSVR